MLRVRVMNKFHDKDGKLIGYTIQNEDNPSEVMNVLKDKLKMAVKSGTCEVVNMTMTSDGRLIGRAGKEPTPRKPRFTLEIKELYNIGKDIIGGEIVDTQTGNSRYFTAQNIEAMIKRGMLVRTGEEKKRAFKSIYNKVLKTVEGSLTAPLKLGVQKTGKDLYTIGTESEWFKSVNESVVALTAMCIIYAMKVAKIRVTAVDTETARVTVNGLTGINDVKKAIKDAGLNKL